MLKAIFSSILFLSIISSSCNVVKYTPEKFPSNQIIWGTGGGFTGIEYTYTLLPNGQLFLRQGVGSPYIELKPMKKKEAKPFFEKVASLQLFKQDIDKPGNMYYFLQEVTEETDSKATWGAGDYIPPSGVVALYKELDLLNTRPVLKKNVDGNETPKEEEEKKPSDPKKW